MCFSAVLLEMYCELYLSRLGLRAVGGVFSLLSVLFARLWLFVCFKLFLLRVVVAAVRFGAFIILSGLGLRVWCAFSEALWR